MQEPNPYSVPGANLGGSDSFAGEQGVTQGVVEQLAKTKGWTRFIGVLSMLGGGLLILVMVITSSAMANLDLGKMPRTALAVGLGLYLVIGGLYLVAGLKLSGFSSAVTRLIYSGKQKNLEDALDRQRSFWVFAGVLSIVFFVVAALVMLGIALSSRSGLPLP